MQRLVVVIAAASRGGASGAGGLSERSGGVAPRAVAASVGDATTGWCLLPDGPNHPNGAGLGALALTSSSAAARSSRQSASSRSSSCGGGEGEGGPERLAALTSVCERGETLHES